MGFIVLLKEKQTEPAFLCSVMLSNSQHFLNTVSYWKDLGIHNIINLFYFADTIFEPCPVLQELVQIA